MYKVAWVLLIIGGLNWLLVGIFGWDVGELFGGQGAVISRIIYILVGLSAIVALFNHKGHGHKKMEGGMNQGGDM